MHEEISPKEMPGWLRGFEVDDGSQELPLDSVLEGSCFYPACRFDGSVVKLLAGLVHSFVYVDYDVTLSELRTKFDEPGFRGYRMFFGREVTRAELGVVDWTPEIKPQSSDGRMEMLQRMQRGEEDGFPFAHWSIWEREASYPESHGPPRFSLLYVGGEGCATLQGLYGRLDITPDIVAVIQPGTSFGKNWTVFQRPGGYFARTLREVCPERPEFLAYGGYAGPDVYDEPCWPEYSELVLTAQPRSLHLYRRSG